MSDQLTYDYTNLAWVVNGRYQKCNHFHCRHAPVANALVCYGTVHVGERVDPQAEVH